MYVVIRGQLAAGICLSSTIQVLGTKLRLSGLVADILDSDPSLQQPAFVLMTLVRECLTPAHTLIHPTIPGGVNSKMQT